MQKMVEKKNKDGKVFCKFDRKGRKGTYAILPKSSQYKFCELVELHGFEALPSGFYKNDGIGLTGGGIFIFDEILKKYGKKLKLTITKTGKSKLNAKGQIIKVQVNHQALTELNATVRATKQLRNEENRTTARAFLSSQFQQQFKNFKKLKVQYSPGMLRATLAKPNINARLNAEDRQALEDFIPEYLSGIKGSLRAKSKIKVIFDSLDAGKRVYLEKVVHEFRKKLAQPAQSEAVWQEFLRDNILLLRNNYSEVLEKESVTLQGKFPDFMLIDPYSYLDVYEIKKPTTTLLKHDKGRNNYYWDAEMAKAISQVENYLHQIQRNCDAFINDIRKAKGMEINIVRPRGYIIAGTRSQLKGPKMIDDFRILAESFKHIDILLYDDLLENLATFVERLKSS